MPRRAREVTLEVFPSEAFTGVKDRVAAPPAVVVGAPREKVFHAACCSDAVQFLLLVNLYASFDRYRLNPAIFVLDFDLH